MSNNRYSDLFLLPLPKKNLAAYKKIARRFGKISRKCGALDYRELKGDDLFPKGCLSFARLMPIRKNEALIAAVVDYKSRAHRDQVMKKVMKDPWVLGMTVDMHHKPLFNMKKMAYGGFAAIVKA